MNRSLLITRPGHDKTTRYLFAWNEELIALAKEKNFQVMDLQKEKANRLEVESRLRKMKPSLVVINGHGADHCVAGHEDEVLLEAGVNEKLLDAKVVYSLSCNSAALLGVKSINAGAVCYIGYRQEFIFCHKEDKINKPLEDDVAGLFLAPSNKVVSSLLKGHSTGEASRKSKDLSVCNMQKLLSSAASRESVQYARFLYWNMKHQVCLGNSEIAFI